MTLQDKMRACGKAGKLIPSCNKAKTLSVLDPKQKREMSAREKEAAIYARLKLRRDANAIPFNSLRRPNK